MNEKSFLFGYVCGVLVVAIALVADYVFDRHESIPLPPQPASAGKDK